MAEPIVKFLHWGLIDYKEAWDKQETMLQKMVHTKLNERDLPESQKTKLLNHLIFCQHPHVYTLGKSGDEKNLLLNDEGLKNAAADFYKVNRGGDITYHGPGQIVGYPIFDLEQFFTDIHKYLRYLEEAIIKTCAYYGVITERYEGYTGVWIDAHKPTARKICAMGVRCSRWVTMHGFAFNVNTDLTYFKHIVPCGIEDKDVTSLQRELGKPLDLKEVEAILKDNIGQIFNFKWQ